ncbi:MAG TPA: solute carrier family 23 protein [Candidatus Dormibacteraeota bacterium]|nr:solute carrier family 23 protein [Candidatus Dormibacteraeota bacterium]
MAVATTAREKDVIYPEQRLGWPQTILMGLQHVMAMFGATVLVPLILGFNPNTVIFFSGVATLIFLFVTGFKVPSYLGSSFSFIGSVLAVQGSGAHVNHGLTYAGIVMAGVIYLIIGVVVHFVGVNPIRYLLPPVVTGTVVAVIGLALASAATGNYSGEPFTATVTLLAAVGAAVYLRGFPRLLPVLIGIVVGYLVSIVYPACQDAKSACHVDFTSIAHASIVGVPTFSTPDFSQFGTTLGLFFFIPVILVAENAGHVYAISGIMKRDLSNMLGRTFMGDGLATTISGLLGGTGETTYAENIGVMGITRVFSIMVFVVAAVFAILLGFIPIFGALVRSIPVSVQGGIEIYLFGLIAVIGGKIWVDAKVDFSKRANLAVAAIPLIIAAGISATTPIPIHLFGQTLVFNNLGLGALSAIVLYQLLRPGHITDKESEPAEVVSS